MNGFCARGSSMLLTKVKSSNSVNNPGNSRHFTDEETEVKNKLNIPKGTLHTCGKTRKKKIKVNETIGIHVHT